MRGEEVPTELDSTGFALGVVSQLRELRSYDPYPLYDTETLIQTTPPERWLEITRLEVVDSTPERATLRLVYAEGVTALMDVEVRGDDRFAFEFRSLDSAEPIAYLRLRFEVDPSEAYYGLGEYFDTVNHRGHLRAMQIELDPSIDSGYNDAHVPVPFVTGTRGWGLFVQTDAPSVFALGTEEEDQVEVAVGSTGDPAPSLQFHLFAADHPLDITKLYYDTTGYPVRPAPWALGPMVWRDENQDQAEVLDDARTMRELDLPTNAMWIDRPYATAVNTFDFSASMFDDAERMIAELHELGFRVGLWHTPYLDEEDSAAEALVAEAEENGFFPPQSGLVFNNWGRPIDLTNEAAFAWWQTLIRRYTDLGIEGFKLDYGEDIVLGGLGGARNVWRFHDGSDERTMHAAYQRLYHRVYAETLPSTGGFLLCRGGTWGDQANVSIIWPGDLDANFSEYGEERSDGEETYRSVGGLPAGLIAGLSLGPSGFPLYGSDTGGYRHAPPDKEVFTRWFQVTSLSPVMQIGTNTNDVAWEPTEGNGFDAEMLDWYRQYTRLHLRLFPYIWTLIDNLYTDGRSPQRPTGLAFPELGEHPSDTFLLGDSLFVAPVVERDARTKTFMAPPGEWVDWWSGVSIEGGVVHTVEAPLAHLPLMLRSGGIVPMLRPEVDTLAPTRRPMLVDSFDTDPGRAFVITTPGEANTFTLFDGSSFAHRMSSDWELEWTAGTTFNQGAIIQVIGFGSEPTQPPLNQAGAAMTRVENLASLRLSESSWTYAEERGGTLSIAMPASGGTVRLPIR